MKAVQIHAYGGPEVLKYEDVPQPQPKANQILVRVHAAGVNPVDWKFREGYLTATLPMIMGIDISGVVESVGNGVTKYRAGDTVFGMWVTLESPSITEMAVSLGLDWIVIDAEHGQLDWQEVVGHIRATVRSDTVALVRGPLVLFAVGDDTPSFTRQQLLSAAQIDGPAAFPER